ncbi:MAG: chemotaxis protein [Rhizobiales bacterium PAR1]|nr:MAG: chemotaxis protein [Rhizobiales bacterium PAR1]
MIGNFLRRAAWGIPQIEAKAEVAAPEGAGAAEDGAETAESILSTFDAIEADLRGILGRIKDSNAGVARSVIDANIALDKIRGHVQGLAALAHSAIERSSTLALATQDLSASSDAIQRQVQNASSVSAAADHTVDDVLNTVKRLSDSSTEIGSVVNTISAIARQTNLLALNATIEAARAGDAGRGFAVVANEVKQLAHETHQATEIVRRQVQSVLSDATASIRGVEEIHQVVGRIRPVFEAVSTATDHQITATRSIIDASHDVSDFFREIEGATASITSEAECASQVTASAGASGEAVERLSTRLMVILRENPLTNRRMQDRFPIDLKVDVTSSGQLYIVQTVDLSEGGMWLQSDLLPEREVGHIFEARLDGIGLVSATIVRAGPGEWRTQFTEMASSVRSALLAHLAKIRENYAPLIDRAQAAASEITEILTQAIDSGSVSEAALFDDTYTPISGTNPQQFEAPCLSILQKLLPTIQERYLKLDPAMTLCVAADRNGYIPVHNAVYSKPQRPDDPVWNTANARNKRIFDDRAGYAAARNTRAFLVQSYARDMGSRMVRTREVDAPITIKGRHWGCIRTAYQI